MNLKVLFYSCHDELQINVMFPRPKLKVSQKLTPLVLVEFVEGFEPGNWRLVFRKVPRRVLAGLPGHVRPGLGGVRSALLSRRGLFRGATVVRIVLPRLATPWTLRPVRDAWYGHHTTPRVVSFWL